MPKLHTLNANSEVATGFNLVLINYLRFGPTLVTTDTGLAIDLKNGTVNGQSLVWDLVGSGAGFFLAPSASPPWNPMFSMTIGGVSSVRVQMSGNESYGYDRFVDFNGTTYRYVSDSTYTLTADSVMRVSNGTCLKAGTLIAVPGGHKPVDKIRIGDSVISLNPETGRNEPDTVASCDGDQFKIGAEWDRWVFADGTVLSTVNPHRFYCAERGEFVYLADWKTGNHVVKIDGSRTALVRHERIKEAVRHFTLFTERWNNYYADGCLSGNRHSTQIILKEGA
jgi:hypothetical protein